MASNIEDINPPLQQQQHQTRPPPPPPPPPPSPPSSSPYSTTPPQQQQQGNKRRKSVEYHYSKYIQIRALLKGLRPSFMEVLRARDFRNSRGANEIRKGMRLMMEMSKQLRSDTILTGKGRKGEACEEYIERCQEEQHVERNEKMQEEPSTPAMNTDKSQQDDEPTGLYVIGGSPIGSNFIMYPGSALVFYGPRKSRA